MTTFGVGTNSRTWAEWLLNQLPSTRHTKDLSSPGTISRKLEWVEFLNWAGVPQDAANQLAKDRGRWVAGIHQALSKLKDCGQTDIYPFEAAREWRLFAGRITSSSTPSLDSGFVVTMAMDCLARNCRVCLKKGCEKLFLERGKNKKYCSPTCALTVAKKKYRKRKREGNVKA